jgi:photosystem II stability/assembly factor-like uncharacterized protein
MEPKVILAPNGNGIARAERNAQEQWAIEFFLKDQDVRCLAADLHNPHRVYAGTQGEGMLRSEDGGQTWQACGLQGKIVKSIAVSPRHADTVYAGLKPASMVVSHDGGLTWEELTGFRRIPWRWLWFSPAEKPGQAYIQAIAVSPGDPDVILAGIEFGAVVRSSDGGLTWSGHRRGALRDCHDLKFHASNGDWAYEAGGTGGGASLSRDGGKTWRKMKQGLAKNYGVACAADALKPEVWYVSVAPSPNKAYGAEAEAYLYRSNGGADWHPIGWEPHPMGQMPISLVTDRCEPGHLYAGLTNGDIWHTPDYGESWDRLPINLKWIWRSMIVL